MLLSSNVFEASLPATFLLRTTCLGMVMSVPWLEAPHFSVEVFSSTHRTALLLSRTSSYFAIKSLSQSVMLSPFTLFVGKKLRVKLPVLGHPVPLHISDFWGQKLLFSI